MTSKPTTRTAPRPTKARSSARTRPTTTRGDATRARIINAARKIAVHYGPTGLTLRAVATETGVALSNLQFHFANHNDLLRAVLDAELAAGERFVVKAVAARPHDLAGAAIDAFLALQHQRGAARLFFSFWAVATTSRPLRDALHAFYANWIARIAAVAAPELHERAWLFVALLEGASLFRCGVAGTTNAAQENALRAQLHLIIGVPARESQRAYAEMNARE
jgi:AcrR family transcriptional regulator